jgi:tetratricopeptide (TPR) repeat protein
MPHLPAWNRCFWISSLLLVAVCAPLTAAPSIDPGYEHFYNNEFDQALLYFEDQLKAHSDDPELYNHVAQTLLYREMLRDGALESQLVTGNNPFLRRPKMEISTADQNLFHSYVSKSIELSQERLAKNPRDIDALYALSVAHGLKSNYLFLVKKSWLDALREATDARKVSQTILQIDPKELDAYLIIGLNHYIVGSLPFYMRALGFIGGFSGDRTGGIRDLELVREHGRRNRYDAEILLAAIYRREKDPQKAIPLLEDLASTFPRNYLFRLEQIQMYSDAGDKKAALAVIAEIQKLKDDNSPGYGSIPDEKIEYVAGNLLFWYGDLPLALQKLQRATEGVSHLDLSTAVLAWLRLGQIYDLQDNRAQAIGAYQKTLEIAPKSEAAAEAKHYINSQYRRKDNNG